MVCEASRIVVAQCHERLLAGVDRAIREKGRIQDVARESIGGVFHRRSLQPSKREPLHLWLEKQKQSIHGPGFSAILQLTVQTINVETLTDALSDDSRSVIR